MSIIDNQGVVHVYGNDIPHWFVPDPGCEGLPDDLPWRSHSPLTHRGFMPGGYSGPGCAPIVLERLIEVCRAVEIPVGFGNGFYSEDLIRRGFDCGGKFVSLGMAKLVRPWRVPRLIDFAKSYSAKEDAND